MVCLIFDGVSSEADKLESNYQRSYYLSAPILLEKQIKGTVLIPDATLQNFHFFCGSIAF